MAGGICTLLYSRLLETVPIQRLTLGGICIYRGARGLMERRLGRSECHIGSTRGITSVAGDGRVRFPRTMRHEVYSTIIDAARRLRPELKSPSASKSRCCGRDGADSRTSAAATVGYRTCLQLLRERLGVLWTGVDKCHRLRATMSPQEHLLSANGQGKSGQYHGERRDS